MTPIVRNLGPVTLTLGEETLTPPISGVMTLVTRGEQQNSDGSPRELHYSCENPVLGAYGVTFICSGYWEYKSWNVITEIKVGGYTLKASWWDK